MKIVPIEFDQQVENLLSRENLPTTDLQGSNSVKLWGCYLNEKLTATIGVVLYDDVALLRSLAVDTASRRSGIGHKLLSIAEAWTQKNDVAHLYLLTETAEWFFLKYGYAVLERDKAPLAIARTAQFSGLCPSSAIFMHKRLLA